MKLSLNAMIIAGAAVFLFISVMNLILRPYGGVYLAMLTSLYPGYDPVNVPIALIVGTLYSLLAEDWQVFCSAGFTISSQRDAETQIHDNLVAIDQLDSSVPGVSEATK
jgi:hypothetical protein